MKFINKILRLNWGLFPLYASSFGLFYGLILGWKVGLVAGIFFGFCMVLCGGVIKQEKVKGEDVIVLNIPRYYSYIIILGVWGFLGSSVIIMALTKNTKGFVISGLLVAISAVFLWLFYLIAKQFIIDSRRLIVKTKFAFLSKERIYNLEDIKSMKVTWYQTLNVTFSDGKTEWLYALNGDLLHLEPYLGKNRNPMVEGLFRLKQEIESRKGKFDGVIDEFDQSKIEKIRFSPVGVSGFLLSSICLMSIVLGVVVFIRTQSLSHISTRDAGHVRLLDVYGAFGFYKGPEFYSLKNEFEKTCLVKNDYNCRIAYYFNQVGNERDTIEWIRKSCSLTDPYSCYSLLIEEKATKQDVETATIVLDSICGNEEFKEQVCCTCYFQQKNRTRRPAQE